MNVFGLILLLGVGAFTVTLAVSIIAEFLPRNKKKPPDDEVNT